MTKDFTWTMQSGKQAKITAIYSETMQTTTPTYDGYNLNPVTEPTKSSDTILILYVDGKRFDNCKNTFFWHLMDTVSDGCKVKKIEGLPVGFKIGSPEIERYEKFLAEVFEEGKSDEVKAYEAEMKRAKIEKELKRYIETYEAAQKQSDIPDHATAVKRAKQYNDLHNEGGEGYIPRIICKEELDDAVEFISQNSDYFKN